MFHLISWFWLNILQKLVKNRQFFSNVLPTEKSFTPWWQCDHIAEKTETIHRITLFGPFLDLVHLSLRLSLHVSMQEERVQALSHLVCWKKVGVLDCYSPAICAWKVFLVWQEEISCLNQVQERVEMFLKTRFTEELNVKFLDTNKNVWYLLLLASSCPFEVFRIWSCFKLQCILLGFYAKHWH